MSSVGPARTDGRRGLFCLFLAPLLLCSVIAFQQFLSDHYQGRARRDRDNLGEAARWLGKAVRVDPEDAEAWRNLGAVYQLMAGKTDDPESKLPDLKKAEVSYAAAVREVPTESANHINLGWVRYQMDRIRGAPPRGEVGQSFRLAALLDPFNYYPHYLLGDYLLHHGRREEAFAEFHKAIEVYPHDEVIRAVLRSAMRSTRDYGQLGQVIPQGLVLAHGYFATALFEELHDWDACKQEYQKIFRLDPLNLFHRNSYLGYCIQSGDVTAAVQEVEERTSLLGEEPGVLLRLAEFLKYKGELDRAAETCRRLLEIKPDFPGAQVMMAEINKAQGNLVEAAKAYENQIKTHPEDPEGYHGLALLYQRHGNPYKAAELLLQAAYLAPAQSAYQSDLADTYLLLGLPDKALEALSRCKQIDPGGLAAYLKSGGIYLEQEDWLQAGREFSEALKLQPDHQEALKGFLQAQSRIP